MMNYDIFINITQRQIHGIKNHSIWIKIHRENNKQNQVEFPKAKRKKLK